MMILVISRGERVGRVRAKCLREGKEWARRGSVRS